MSIRKGFLRNQSVREVRGFTVAVELLCILLTATACLPTNNLSNGTLASASNTSAVTTTSDSSTTAEDGAKGQCISIDPSKPERAYCITCYSKTLQTYCPGAQDATQCTDPNVSSNFTNYVNLCIANSLTSGGSSCFKTCTTGWYLDTATCSCVSSLPSADTGSTTGTTDSGQTDYGPPIVSVVWPQFAGSSSRYAKQQAQDPEAQCRATVPVRFDVRNRGNSVQRLNVYNWLMNYPNATTDIQNVTTPALNTYSGEVWGEFDVVTGTAKAVDEFIYYNNFEDGIVTNLDSGVKVGFTSDGVTDSPLYLPVLYSESLSQFLGPFSSTQSTQFQQTLPAGTYVASMSFIVIDAWNGDWDGHHFQLYLDGATSPLFDKTFSNDATKTQSYPNKALTSGTNLGFTAGVNDSIYNINLRFTHSCPDSNPCALKLRFTGAGLPNDTTAQWGLDNFSLAPVQQHAMKYSFTDTNQLTSHYCMWLDIYSTCYLTGSTNDPSQTRCSCWAEQSYVNGISSMAVRTDIPEKCMDDPAAGPAITPYIHDGVGHHKTTDCGPAGGAIVSIGGISNVCRFNAPSCPAGWTPYLNWTTTAPNTSATYYDSHMIDTNADLVPDTCVTFNGRTGVSGSHAWANVDPASEARTYTGTNNDGCALATSTTVNSTVTQIGCY